MSGSPIGGAPRAAAAAGSGTDSGPAAAAWNAPTAASSSHIDPQFATNSSLCDPDASTSVTSDVAVLDGRRLPFPSMRQDVDPDKQKKLRALTLDAGGGALDGLRGRSITSRGGGSSAGGFEDSRHSHSNNSGVRPYRATPSVTVGGVALGVLTGIVTPFVVDPRTGTPSVIVGQRPPTPDTRGSAASPMSVQHTNTFDGDLERPMLVVPGVVSSPEKSSGGHFRLPAVAPPPTYEAHILTHNQMALASSSAQDPTVAHTFADVVDAAASTAAPLKSPQNSEATRSPRKAAPKKSPARRGSTPMQLAGAPTRTDSLAECGVPQSPPDGPPDHIVTVRSTAAPLPPPDLIGRASSSSDEFSAPREPSCPVPPTDEHATSSRSSATQSHSPSSVLSPVGRSEPSRWHRWSPSLDDLVMRMITTDLVPSYAEVRQRELLVHQVIQAYVHALSRVVPGRFDVKYCIFGSVQTRTCLPDGDNDVAVFVYPHAECPNNKSMEEALKNYPMLGADLMARARDYITLANPLIKVDALVFAEVRVLKLVVDGMNIDLTAGQIGGFTAAAFLCEVDRILGFEHLFRYSLILIKAWCLHDARVVGGAGGYLSTFAIATILIAVFNELNASGAPKREMQPLRVLHHFLRYCADFDFAHSVLTIYGPVPIDGVNRFIDDLPNLAVDPASIVGKARISRRAVEEAQRRYGSAQEAAPVSGSPSGQATPPASSPSGTATPPALGGVAPPSFPLRHMNVMDPLRPLNNLTRGVNLSHVHRLGSVFRRGADTLTSMSETLGAEPMTFIERFFPGVLEALQSFPTSDRSLPPNAVKCKLCLKPSVFCVDMRDMEFIAKDVTTPPTGVTSATERGFELTAAAHNLRGHPQHHLTLHHHHHPHHHPMPVHPHAVMPGHIKPVTPQVGFRPLMASGAPMRGGGPLAPAHGNGAQWSSSPQSWAAQGQGRAPQGSTYGAVPSPGGHHFQQRAQPASSSGFTSHAAHWTPRDFDVGPGTHQRRQSESALSLRSPAGLAAGAPAAAGTASGQPSTPPQPQQPPARAANSKRAPKHHAKANAEAPSQPLHNVPSTTDTADATS